MTSADNGFLEQVASPRFCERLFAHLPDVVFCLKDGKRRYQAANPAFSARLGFSDPQKLLGKTAEDFFPEPLTMVYREQDLQVLESGREMIDHLELVTNRDGSLGWYLASKVPLHNAAGEVIGLASISRDLGTPSHDDPEFPGLQRVVKHIRGYGDQTAFTRQFHTTVGLPPAAYREHAKRHV